MLEGGAYALVSRANRVNASSCIDDMDGQIRILETRNKYPPMYASPGISRHGNVVQLVFTAPGVGLHVSLKLL